MNKPINALLLIFCLTLINNSCKVEKKQNPNIIYILADDLGYGDISALNRDSKIHTVAIDKLADEGMVFTDAHSNSAVCTPTRYGILTGRYAWRSRLKHGVLWSYSEPLIDSVRLTVPKLLKSQGYSTVCIGKWHLGLDWTKDSSGTVDYSKKFKNGPNTAGFDYFFGITASLDIPPYVYIENDRVTQVPVDTLTAKSGKSFWRKGPVAPDFKMEEVLPNLTRKAVDYIARQSEKENPFFLYFALTAPHTPILPSKEFRGKSHTNEYGDFVLMVDDVVRQIEEAVSSAGIEDNTIIFFTSDNGCSPMADFKELDSLGHNPSYVFRGAKSDIFEGGHRIPFIVKWPEKVKGGSEYHNTVCLTDLLSTCAAITGSSVPDNAGEDSYNLLPVLLSEIGDKPVRDATVHHSINGSFSIRQGNWKLNFCPGSGGWSYPRPKEAKELGLYPIQLYNVLTDSAETVNLAEKNPEVVEKLTRLMENYISDGRSTPGHKQQNEGETILFKK
jgi:arylsulfatase A-like enzyme